MPRNHLPIFAALLLLALPTAFAQTPPPPAGGDVVQLQFPNNDINDIANYFELLTGRRLIKDSNLQGARISLMAQDVSKKEAIELIKSALLLNGYTLIDVDEKTTKLLGATKPARSEAVPLYTDPAQLPAGEEVVSYFMPFRYLKSSDAFAAFQNYAPQHAYGFYTDVPSVNAIVVTDNASTVRRLLSLKDVIDVQGAKTVTEFFTLQRADAEKVSEILQKMFEKTDESPGARSVVTPPRPVPAPGAPPVPQQAAQTGNTLVPAVPQRVQIFADKRTNRVMVVGPEAQMDYIGTIIANLDVSMPFDEVLERPLRFVRAADVLPIVANLLADRSDDKNGQPGQNPAGGDNQNSNNNNNDDNSGNNDNSGGGGGGGSAGGGGLSTRDTTSFRRENTKPLSLSVGNSRIVADRSMNKILVFGPPEARAKAARVLEMLDQRPKQVYLACVIGQLTLTNDTEFGISYLIKPGTWRILGHGTSSDIANLFANRNGTIDVVPGASDAVNAAASAATTAARAAVPALAGLTVFGAIGDSVDVLVRALASTNRFQVISRPVIYTSNGQGALISSGQQVPVPTSTLTTAVDVTANNSGNSVTSNIEYKNVVLELDVRPLINSDREVTLEIKQRNDNVQSQVQISNNQVPVVATQTLNTSVTVPNRSTIVLGGLITDQEERVATGIPFLKDIPGLGYLFSNTTKKKERRELIVMIQPFIINNGYDLKDANYVERANTSFKSQAALFDQPVPIKRATLPGVTDLPPQEIR
jgi:type II secretion system protein D